MTEQSPNTVTAVEERRVKTDRRSHKHDELFQHAVTEGYFLELRKGERRSSSAEVEVRL